MNESLRIWDDLIVVEQAGFRSRIFRVNDCFYLIVEKLKSRLGDRLGGRKRADKHGLYPL